MMIVESKSEDMRLPSLNVKYMSAQLFDKRKGGRPKRVKGGLIREDSSDDEGESKAKKQKLLLKW